MSNFGRGRGTVGLGHRTRWTLCVGLSAALVAFFAPLASASDQGAAATRKAAKPVTAGKISPAQITTSSDKALQKLDPKLRKAYRKHNGATVAVFVSVVGNPKSVTRKLDRAHSTKSGNVSLVVGRVPAGQLVKLASDTKVLSVRQVTLHAWTARRSPVSRHRAQPAERRGQDEGRRRRSRPPTSPTPTRRRRAVRRSRSSRSSTSWTPRPTTSPRPGRQGLHRQGHDGRRVRQRHRLVAPRPDRRRRSPEPKAAGRPRSTRSALCSGWLTRARSSEGLSWYIRTTTADLRGRRRDLLRWTSRPRPARRATSANPPGTNEHTYTLPGSWSKSGTVLLGSHPDDYALDFFGERPAFLVTDPNTAGVYDTIYVDLNDDYTSATRSRSPRSRRGPGATSTVTATSTSPAAWPTTSPTARATTAPRCPVVSRTSVVEVKGEPGRARRLDRRLRPRHRGSRHPLRQQHRRPGRDERQTCRRSATSPAASSRLPSSAVHRDATMVPFGDIYFSFDFSTQFAYLLSNEHGIDVTSNSYGSSDDDNDGLDAASQEADIWHTAFGGKTTPLFSTGNGAPGYGTTTPPSPVVGIKVGASTQYGATGWDSIKQVQPGQRQRRRELVQPWARRDRQHRRRPRRRRCLLAGLDEPVAGAGGRRRRPERLGDLGWHEPFHAGRRRGGGAGLPGLPQRRTAATSRRTSTRTAKGFLKSGATDLGYDTYIQGSGSLNAGRSVRLAKGDQANKPGAAVSPDEWRPGDYRGEQLRGIPVSSSRRGRATRRSSPCPDQGSYKVSDRVLRRIAVKKFDFTTSDLSDETPSLFNAPNYLINLTKLVKQTQVGRPDGDPGELSVRPVRPRRRLCGRPAVAPDHVQLDRPEPRRPALARQGPRRHRRQHALGQSPTTTVTRSRTSRSPRSSAASTSGSPTSTRRPTPTRT